MYLFSRYEEKKANGRALSISGLIPNRNLTVPKKIPKKKKTIPANLKLTGKSISGFFILGYFKYADGEKSTWEVVPSSK
jgi:hypothetical protein